jgi:hypothetical protein
MPDAEPDALITSKTIRDAHGRVYDSRKGLRSYYRYGPRKLIDLCNSQFSNRPGDEVKIKIPKIHESVFKRMQRSAYPYAPIGIPEKYEVVSEKGEILDPCYETPENACARAQAQENVWDLVWKRKIISNASKGILIYPFCIHFSVWFQGKLN